MIKEWIADGLLIATELKPMDAPSERSRVKGLGTRKAAWASAAVELKSSVTIR